MILRTLPKLQPPAWQRELQRAITDPRELVAVLGLDPALLAGASHGVAQFPMRVPRGYVARMRHGDPLDPLLRQVLPLGSEAQITDGFAHDAVGDMASLRDGGVLHKYAGRALLVTTGACAVHCRYCFRRHFPYDEVNASRQDWAAAIEVLRADTSISEVILSGGDPLSLSDRRLASLARALDGLSQLRRLRIHTRQPVVLPERVDDSLLHWLADGRLRKIVVIHANHAQELDGSVQHALERLSTSGATLLNQSVLLRGINDSVEALTRLSERLFECGVMPYYLHLLDRVQGTAHFEVPAREAAELMRGVAARLPGYLVPRLVSERPGAPSNLPVHW